jgi:hypothetical protein
MPDIYQHSELDIAEFELKFYEIYERYISEAAISVDLSSHLFCICLDQLIMFCVWARKSEEQSDIIHKILNENPDLRPEVRNGLALVLIYTFSSAKKKSLGSVRNFFRVLQDSESGLGIVNKTSLRNHNDPFQYLAFIKVNHCTCYKLSITNFIVLYLWAHTCSRNPRKREAPKDSNIKEITINREITRCFLFSYFFIALES